MSRLSAGDTRGDTFMSTLFRHPPPLMTPAAEAAAALRTKRPPIDPLFGPSLGQVTSGPLWASQTEKKVVGDDLTPDIVSSWIEKSKEPSQPTTTLQALVNLKRPTLRLSPLTSAQDAAPADQHHYGLEFEYDCDAPKCGIYVYVYLPKAHPDAPLTPRDLAKLLVFETVVDGGFGKHLTLEEGAILELGRFEHPQGHPSGPGEMAPVAEAPPSGDLASAPSSDVGPARNNARRRFTHFHFRKRGQNQSISGPALAVVDADPAGHGEPGKTKDANPDDDGVKVSIRLAALDEQGTELALQNEQVTFLDICRFGNKETVDGVEPVEDTRPWVVKVVKREATIGPHSFILHEIFGLTSASSHTAAPTAPAPMATHTYPPEEGQPPMQVEEEDPQSECLLCLSSPREVVLLPCRHLVACKDCALNMVEFGAGGNITQATEPVAAGDEIAPSPGGAGAPAEPAPAATPNQRRKRKAKGWFCPVCRQPYMSMLRLTTVPPGVPEKTEGESSVTEDGNMPAVPAEAHVENGTEMRSNGLLGVRPGFLRGLSLGRAPTSDVENQVSAVRA